MRIGIDLDGVVVNSIPRWVEVINRSGAGYGPDELPETHSWPERAAYSDANELEMLILPGPMPGAREALARLRSQGHTLIVVSARAPRVRRLTEAWLDYHGLAADGFHLLEGASKAAVALEERLDLLVEDTPHQALAVAEAGVPVLLYGAPYNRAVSHPLIHRCEGWAAVLEAISQRIVA